ncbi:multiple epidermal growth factor-like domains protein 10 [Saccostrea echinata]|uniref:multiple epidermal growth factor-like domains protein 10 n=1 Tax=Saccostrea echinata TaxID=191078 RepID=UPI002A821416|nr:multiple epidermal growth factor-like domains protein 10 [Saccostrea echinata]
MCYKDGPELPLLNFTTNCIRYGRYVIYYNERLSGVTYPEGYESMSYIQLCEVVVEACPNGSYGHECKSKCSGHCKDRTPCNHVTGECARGCNVGWTGTLCNKPCDAGRFGVNCTSYCSGHCLNDESCNKETGHCDLGCSGGYIGDLCNIECTPGWFGKECKYRCSGHCAEDESCNHVDGICSRGCKDGYIGHNCTTACTVNRYGKNCTSVCSSKCTSTCAHTDGSCECSSGWMGSPHCNKNLTVAVLQDAKNRFLEKCVFKAKKDQRRKFQQQPVSHGYG